MSELISVSELRVRRGAFQLHVPSWSVPAGCVVGVVGPNGAGKTTLLDLVCGFTRPDAGAVRVFGHDPHREVEVVRARLGHMSDDMPVFRMSVAGLLRTLSGYYPTWDAELAEELIARFELDPGARTWKLSKGQGTRLRLVCAMAFRPQLLVLDEPATGLDVGGRRDLLRTVLEVVADSDRSVVVSSHLLTDLERVADTLLVLRGGRVLAHGPTDSLVGDDATLEEAALRWQVGASR